MKLIRDVFDSTKKIDRRIEKVITYNAIESEQLKKEITEYVVTDRIADSFENLLDKMEIGLEGGDNYEIGVWVSGFYGSGKSSFTKYLGFALDDSIQIEGEQFLKFLQNQIKSISVRQRIATIAKRYPSTVVMLDLASEQDAESTMVKISTVLYSKILQWAGYSKDIKVAYLEFMLERDGKFEKFKERILEISGGKSWEEMHHQPLTVKTFASRVASEFYPQIWPDIKTFNTIKIEEMVSEHNRVKEMIDIILRRSGKENIILILDEVGQYVASRDDLILNLDGLAKNVKALGHGKVWIIATAQQTLTEDDPRALMNSAKLFKLKDRFPISIDLEASDIKEICWTRLLGKSGRGEKALQELYDKNGDLLRHSTQLKNTRFYKSDLDRKTFCNLYPFLPQHFDILLELLGRLAKTSGGIGLRSAIKVIQDILIDQSGVRHGQTLLADAAGGTLASTVHIYDTLKRDIHRSYNHLVEAVDKVERIFDSSSIHKDVAKSIAVLQILENFPVTAENISAVMHPSVDSPSIYNRVSSAIKELLDESVVHLSEVDGNLRFMSEAVSQLEADRVKIVPHSSDTKMIFNSIILNIFSPVPSVTIHGTKKVASGLKVFYGSFPTAIYGDKEPIQLLCNFVMPSQYEVVYQETLIESQQRLNSNNIYLIGKEDSRVHEILVEIYRSRHISKINQNKSVDKEIMDYLKGQIQFAESKEKELSYIIEKNLTAGSFFFRGKPRPVGELAESLNDATKNYLALVAIEVYEKYAEAPIQIKGNVAEKFLKTEKLNRISSEFDPLGLVDSHANINIKHKACISVKDYLERIGQVDGRKLLDDFFAAPYGWQKDTTRYIIAAMLVGGILKLRVSGDDITVRGDVAITAISTINNFNQIGISLRDIAPSNDAKLRACERIRDLVGEDVLPLEEEISQAIMKYFPDIQNEFAALPTQLKNLALPGIDKAHEIQDDIASLLKGDASDGTNKLGGIICPLFDNIQWAQEIKKTFDNGIETVVQEMRNIISKVKAFPETGILTELKENSGLIIRELDEYLSGENFYHFLPEMQTKLNDLNKEVKKAAIAFSAEQMNKLNESINEIQARPAWSLIGVLNQNSIVEYFDRLRISFSENLSGLEKMITHEYSISTTLRNCAKEIARIIEEQQTPAIYEIPKVKDDSEDSKQILFEGLPPTITNTDQIDALIQKLELLKSELEKYSKIIIIWR